ncbi:MAG: hypothetical protein AAFN59_04815 [Pseudomonadota bacterium]
MNSKYTRGYYLRGFSAIAFGVGVAMLSDTPGRDGDMRGLIYFVAFGIALATLETIARNRGWPSKIKKDPRRG